MTASFGALLIGQVLSILGDRLNNIGLIELLSVETGRFTTPGATFEISKLALAMTLPAIVLGPFVGAYIDRMDRRKILIGTGLVRGASVFLILFVRPTLPLWTVYGIVGVLYLANLFFLPARCAIVPEMVPREGLIRANSVLSLGATGATIVGFGVGGVVASLAGWRVALLIDAGIYLGSAAALTVVRTKATPIERQRTARTPYIQIIREAIREILRSRGTRVGVLAPPLLVIAATSAYVLGVPILEGMSPRGTMHVGLLVSLAGAGMAAGCYFTGRALHKFDRARIVLITTPLAVVALTMLGIAHRLVLMAAAVAAAGFAAGPAFVSSETSVQEEAPPRRQATVFALRDMLMKTSLAGMAWLAAAVAGVMGLRGALAAILFTCLAASVSVLVLDR